MIINIGNKAIGDNNPCFIITEIGSNHNRDLDTAKKLINVSVEAGADAVKFQTYSADTLYSKKTPRLSEMNGRTKDEKETPHELIKRLEMPREWHKELADYSIKKGIIFLSTPFDDMAIEELNQFVEAFKIASYDITNLPFLRKIAKKNKPIILSSGTASMEEIEEAVEEITSEGNNKIILLQCTSQYPAKFSDLNLNTIRTFQENFKFPIGLSDHSLGIYGSLAAVALGAKVIEKHITLDKNYKGPDHPFALEPQELRDLVNGIRSIEASLGSKEKNTVESEQENRKLARRSVHAKIKIKRGTIIKENMLILKRPASGLSPKFLDAVIGKQAKQDIEAEDFIDLNKVNINIVAVIQARMKSERLPGKVLMELEGKPLLQHMIERLKNCELINETILAIPNTKEDKKLEEFAKKSGIRFFIGDEENVLDRLMKAAEMAKAEVVIRLTGDCPLIDSKIVDYTIRDHLIKNTDYSSTLVDEDREESFPKGTGTEVMSIQTLRRVHELAKDKYQKEHVTPFIYQNPAIFKISIIPAPRHLRAHFRFTVNTQEDIDFIRELLSLIPKDKRSIYNIIRFLKKNNITQKESIK